MSEAIFQTTGQALHVAFLIMSVEARQESPLRRALLQIMGQQEELTKKQQDWMNQLIGEGSGTVNFGGLSSDEVRAQCAMVTQSVKDHLPAPEMHVIHARFIPTELEELDGGRKRYYFSQERVDAVKALSEYVKAGYSAIKLEAIDCLVAKVFVEHSKTEISFRDLAQSFQTNHMVYARAFPKIKATMKMLETMAINRLTPYFEATGLIELQAEQSC